jgi:hypothetical protein
MIQLGEMYYTIVQYSNRFWATHETSGLIKLYLNEKCSKFLLGKHLSDSFPTQNDLKQGDALSSLLFNFALEYAFIKVKKNQVGLKLEWETSASDFC